MEYFPIFLDIKNKDCLIVGGGQVGLRKTQLLLKAGAKIICISKKFIADFKKIDNIKLIKKEFVASDIKKPVLIIVATDNKNLNEKISLLAQDANIPVNVVDNPKLCTFIMPSIVDRNPIIIATTSSGKAPVLARIIRSKLESTIPNYYGLLAEIAAEFRDKVKQKFNNIKDRRYFWERIFTGIVAEKVFSGQINDAKKMLNDELEKSVSKSGEVYLVGSGPGDPDLLTFKALRLMQQADVILYDRLVSNEVLELVRRDAKLIYVGKERGKHYVKQQDTNKLLIKYAKKGNRVLRLKGGDPFIFGRGGEEIEKLAENNIPFQVVPGITAASGCAAYSGIPLTHRDYSQSCRFVTGHLKNNTMNLPWNELVYENQTIVFYMGLTGAKYLSKKLIEHGMDKKMPVALIERGTTPHHKVYVSNLSKLADLVANTKIQAPTLMIVGKIVKLREKLKWLE